MRTRLAGVLVRAAMGWLGLAASSGHAAEPAQQARVADPGTRDCGLARGLRPCIALVLSGGGARGLAHVGVIEVLESERVPVDLIAGTSMGAIIGGLHASGMDAARLEGELRDLDWAALFASRLPRESLPPRRKDEDADISPVVEIGMRDGELRAPLRALASWGAPSGLTSKTRRLVSQIADFEIIVVSTELEALLLEKDYVVLNWAQVGTVQIFCAKPYRSPAEMHDARFFVWDGDPASVEAFRQALGRAGCRLDGFEAGAQGLKDFGLLFGHGQHLVK